MKIYTKTGDTGETGMANGERVRKDTRRVMAVGALDECSAAIGVLLAIPTDHAAEDLQLLRAAQGNALSIGAIIADAARVTRERHHALDEADVLQLEARIDQLSAALPPLQSFILPGGVPAAAAAHLARTVCRRAEQVLVAITAEIQSEEWPVVLAYCNRLSDYLFVLARSYNQRADADDIPWQVE